MKCSPVLLTDDRFPFAMYLIVASGNALQILPNLTSGSGWYNSKPDYRIS